MAHGFGDTARRLLQAGAAGLLLTLVSLSGRAAVPDYPTRPVTVIVPFPAGGGTDILARVIAKHMTTVLGKPVLVDNRGGAGGNLGIGAVARAKPDGHTLLVSSAIFVNNPSLFKQVPYDPIKDFIPIVLITASPNVILTRADSGIRTVADLLATAKANPDKLNYSSPGIGTSSHLSAELFKLRSRVNITHVPYSGSAPGLTALLGGETQLGFFGIAGGGGPQIVSGKLRALAHTGTGRLKDFPDIPSLAEVGFPGFEAENFNAMLAPAGTPPEIVELLMREVLTILKRQDVAESLQQTGGVNVVAGDKDALRARLARELPIWKEVVEKAGIKPE
jgi:tripartite-type tricarboxylate transporter receptor subunit TctC